MKKNGTLPPLNFSAVKLGDESGPPRIDDGSLKGDVLQVRIAPYGGIAKDDVVTLWLESSNDAARKYVGKSHQVTDPSQDFVMNYAAGELRELNQQLVSFGYRVNDSKESWPTRFYVNLSS